LVQPLADLIRDVQKGERIYAVQGNEWCGWWTGRLREGRQLLAAFGGRAVYYSRWHQMTHPEMADPSAGQPTLYIAVFDVAGLLQEVLNLPAGF
jgi:hypothetical protein